MYRLPIIQIWPSDLYPEVNCIRVHITLFLRTYWIHRHFCEIENHISNNCVWHTRTRPRFISQENGRRRGKSSQLGLFFFSTRQPSKIAVNQYITTVAPFSMATFKKKMGKKKYVLKLIYTSDALARVDTSVTFFSFGLSRGRLQSVFAFS